MRRIWKILGTMGSFLTGYVLSSMLVSSILNSMFLSFITNERELTVGFAVLMGLIVAHWWYKNSAPIK